MKQVILGLIEQRQGEELLVAAEKVQAIFAPLIAAVSELPEGGSLEELQAQVQGLLTEKANLELLVSEKSAEVLSLQAKLQEVDQAVKAVDALIPDPQAQV